MSNSLFHIYAGTQGSAGLYINEIIKALDLANIKQNAFVSYYYPFKNGKKIFYRFTDLAAGKKKTKYRPYIRYVELICGLLIIFFEALFKRPRYINYSLNSSYLPEYAFLVLIKKMLKIKLIITCHDVVPFANSYLNISKENSRRAYLLNMADFLLVHNENSIVDLMQYYQIKPSKIICHPFPIMDLNPWIKADITKTIDFLFIGHLRCEKGINILLESWEKFSSLYPEANLYVVGNNPPNSGIDVTKYKKYNIKFVLHYVDDAVYAQYIASAKCVILPYLRGTNSGIPSSVYSLGSDFIVSDIPMFKNNPLIGKESYFECGNSNSLFEKMCSFYKELHKETSIKKERIDSYRQSFNNQVVQLYSQLLNK